ncbi:SPOR domain-containing protein [Roseomonas nepalensis]|uniref:SPOR domain-containing protein n=1 Tax=Muricoccus nepalensis TaxID=1854500 RepID=A0A502G103_9PROT|nr:SPOR domain-containing protein [Roseomonas nepalensis]
MGAPAQPSAAAAPQPAPAAMATPAITPPPMPASGPAVRTGRVVVQLGAVTSEEAARAEWAKLQAKLPELAGRQPQITRVDRGDQPPLWRIRATNMPDAGTARALCESARGKSLPCAVIGG